MWIVLTLRGDRLHGHPIVVIVRRTSAALIEAVRWSRKSSTRWRCISTSRRLRCVARLRRIPASATSSLLARSIVTVRRLIETERLRQRIVLAKGRTEYIAYTPSAAVVTVAGHVRATLDIVHLLGLNLIAIVGRLHFNQVCASCEFAICEVYEG